MTNETHTTTNGFSRRMVLAIAVLAVVLPLLVVPAQQAEAATTANLQGVCHPEANLVSIQGDADFMWVFIYKYDFTAQDWVIFASKSRWSAYSEAFDTRHGIVDGYYAARVFTYDWATKTMGETWVRDFVQYDANGSHPTTTSNYYCGV